MVPHPYSNPPANDGDFGADDLVGARTSPANDCTGAGFGGVYTLRATARDEVCERERGKLHCDSDSLPAYVDAVKDEEEEKEEEEEEEEEEAVSSRPSSRASSRGICVRCFCCRRAEGADAGRRRRRELARSRAISRSSCSRTDGGTHCGVNRTGTTSICFFLRAFERLRRCCRHEMCLGGGMSVMLADACTRFRTQSAVRCSSESRRSRVADATARRSCCVLLGCRGPPPLPLPLLPPLPLPPPLPLLPPSSSLPTRTANRRMPL